MSLNRYRLKHLSKTRHKGAIKAHQLLKRPDRLIGLILLGNNFVNILASAIATLVAVKLWGEAGILIATIALTIVILIFAEVAPKTLAAMNPERFAFPASHILQPLLKLFYPLVWLVNLITSGLFKLIGIKETNDGENHLTREELRTVVNEAGALIPQRHQKMLLGILDLEKVTVEDIMIPRNEIVGIDINEDIENIQKQLSTSQHTRLPVYQGDIDQVIGLLHVKNALYLQLRNELNKETLNSIIREPYFVPEGTPLNTLLLNFQQQKRRIGMLVDEYGDLKGLVTLEDILEEIVGEFTTVPSSTNKGIHLQDNGSYLIDGTINIRQLNKLMVWELPTDGPKTLSGLIIEYLESMPETGTSLLIADHPIEIIQVKDNTVRTACIFPRLNKQTESSENI
jgi:Mg2+/Co2+ transporter CorB